MFVELIQVNRGCERFRIHASPLEDVWVMISESAATKFALTFSESTANQFSFTISESTGAVGADKSTGHLWTWFH
jgi:hypothetical protein